MLIFKHGIMQFSFLGHLKGIFLWMKTANLKKNQANILQFYLQLDCLWMMSLVMLNDLLLHGQF